MPTDDEILEANRALTRLAHRLSTLPVEELGGRMRELLPSEAADIVTVRRGLGLSFERAPTLGEVFDPEREAMKIGDKRDELIEAVGPDAAVASLRKSLGHANESLDRAHDVRRLLDAIDGNIADLAGAVREVAAVLRAPREARLGDVVARLAALVDDDAGKPHGKKRADRKRKRK